MNDEAISLESDDGDGIDNVRFDFQHKLFQVPDCYFAMSGDNVPMLYLTLGDVAASITLRQLRNEFGLTSATEDGILLDMLSDSLRFVKKIRPGDSIPSEILDGSASWAVEATHMRRAKMRVSLQLASLVGGNEALVIDQDTLVRAESDPEARLRIQKVMGEVAEKLGIGSKRRTEVVAMVERLCTELAYIEALGEALTKITNIRSTARRLIRKYQREGIAEDLGRIEDLIKAPLHELKEEFDGFRAQTDDLLGVLKNFNQQLDYIRSFRDDLRAHLLHWDDLPDAWADLSDDDYDTLEPLVRRTYHFLARHFAQAMNWRR